jgi:hypothetical protein
VTDDSARLRVRLCVRLFRCPHTEER